MNHEPPPHTADLLTRTLDTIAAERGRFQLSFHLVDELLAKWGEADLASRLYAAIPGNRPWEDVADLFGILTWATSDEGHGIREAMEQWLRTPADVRQIQVALHQDFYPFRDRDEMERRLALIMTQWPQVAQHCEKLIEWRRQERGE